MDKQIEKLLIYTDELKQALVLECSKEEARKYGSVQEWNEINRKIKRLERKINALQEREKASCRDGWYDVLYALICCLPIFFFIVKLICILGLVCIFLYYMSLGIGIKFSITTAIGVWIVICAIMCFCERTNHND